MDDADFVAAQTERDINRTLANRQPFVMTEGKPGECDFCGRWFGRIVDGACVPCRNEHERNQR